MAIFKPSPLIGAIAGQVGGVSFVTSARGRVVKGCASTVVRETRLQLAARARFQACRRGWLLLTEAQRLLWSQRAAAVSTTNRLGEPRRWSGFELFTAVNTYNPTYNGTLLTAAPAVALVQPVIITAMYGYVNPWYYFTLGLGSVAKPWAVHVWGATVQCRTDRGVIRNERYLGRFTTLSGNVDVTSAWVAAFGRALRSQVWWQIRVMNATGGYFSVPVVRRAKMLQ